MQKEARKRELMLGAFILVVILGIVLLFNGNTEIALYNSFLAFVLIIAYIISFRIEIPNLYLWVFILIAFAMPFLILALSLL